MTYNEQQIAQDIKTYIQGEFLYDQQSMSVDDDFKLIKQGIIDSLGIFTLIAFLQERFGVEIQAEDVVLENFETINAIKGLVIARK